jgi:hypothetical protein
LGFSKGRYFFEYLNFFGLNLLIDLRLWLSDFRIIDFVLVNFNILFKFVISSLVWLGTVLNES